MLYRVERGWRQGSWRLWVCQRLLLSATLRALSLQ